MLERETQIAQLEAAIERARLDGPACVALIAEAGTGKTALVDELQRRHGREVLFLHGRALQATSRSPYAVWINALGHHLTALPRRDALNLIRSCPDLPRLFPQLRQMFSLSEHPSHIAEGGWAQSQLPVQLARLIGQFSCASPVVLVLDNLQWADESSVELLPPVLSELRGKRVVIVAAYRPEDTAQDALLPRTTAMLAEIKLLEEVMLHPLSCEALGVMARSSGHRLPEAAVEDLYRRTQGNPLFAWECMQDLRADRLDETGSGPFFRGKPPPSVATLIGSRMRDLDDDARRALVTAAVIETDISYRLLRSATGLDDELLLTALERLIERRFLVEDLDADGASYRFCKPLVQQSVYFSLGGARRRYLHQLIGRELMHLDEATGALSAQVARHVISGTAEGDQSHALPYLLVAAEQALQVFGNHEAVSLLQLASRINDAHGADARLRYDVRRNLGESLKRLGRFDAAVEVWNAQLTDADPRQKATLRRCMARALWQAGKEGAAIQQLERGIEELPPDEQSVEEALLRQEYALSLVRRGHVAHALRETDRLALRIDPEVQPELAARVETVRCLAHGLRGDLGAASAAGMRAILLSETLPYPGAAFLAYYMLAALLRFDVDGQRFEALCDECCNIAQRMQAVSLETWALSLRVERYTLTGQLQEAIRIGQQAVRIDSAIGQNTILTRSHAFLAAAHAVAGHLDLAARHLAEAEHLVQTLHKTELRSCVVVVATRAFIDFLEGHFSAAHDRIKRLTAHIETSEPLRFYELHPYVLPLAAEAAARAGQRDDALRVMEKVELLNGNKRHHIDPAMVHTRGLLEAQDGAGDLACATFRTAIAGYTQMQRPFHAARAFMDLADALDAGGEAGAAALALRSAAEIFGRIGAERHFADASQRLRQRGCKPVQSAQRRSASQAISSREMEVAHLIADGKSNKEIAKALFVSVLTVETHVRNILRKLGAKSRVQIASFVLAADRAEGLIED